MEVLEALFSKETEIVEKLRGFAYNLDYEKIFFEHMGPRLKEIFIKRKDKMIIKNFLEAAQYEYGFFDTKIDLQKAFDTYKKYADINDYFCMYKMHMIYLCEYDKFNVPLSRVLEKIYLFKCFAFLPNYMDDWNMKLFEKIDVRLEIAKQLDLEDNNLENHQIFFDLLYAEKEKYNLSVNDINLMKGVLLCTFMEEGKDAHLLAFCEMNSLLPINELDYAYYNAKNKCCYLRNSLKLQSVVSDEDMDKFYKEIENKKLYEFYGDYGNYLLDKKIRTNAEILELMKVAADEGYLFNTFRAYQCHLDYYDFDDIMEDYEKGSTILGYLLDEVVFEKLSFSFFILLTGTLIKYSKYSEKIEANYLIYVKEINDYINSTLTKIEKGNENITSIEYYYAIKAYIYFFGFKGVEEQNLIKANELLNKSNSIAQKTFLIKNNRFIQYRIKKIMLSNNLISNDEFINAKKKLVQFCLQNLSLKYYIFDCYILGEDFIEGISTKKDELSGILIYKSSENIFCTNVIEWFIKGLIKKYLKENEHKIEDKFKDEICSICYTNKVNKAFIPCKHHFCDFCANKLEDNSKKCPICRTEYLCII